MGVRGTDPLWNRKSTYNLSLSQLRIDGKYSLLSHLLSDYKPLEGRTVNYSIFYHCHGHPATHTNLANVWEFHKGRKQLFNTCLLDGQLLGMYGEGKISQ